MKTLRILSGGAAQGLVEALRPAFEAATGCTIDGVFGAVGAMKARLLSGEPADLVILSRALIDELALDGHVVGPVREGHRRRRDRHRRAPGDPLPAVGSTDELRAILRVADEIHLPDPALATAGIHFANVLRDLGIWDESPAGCGRRPTARRPCARSPHRRAAIPSAAPRRPRSFRHRASLLVAPLPPGCELATTYSCAITAHAAAPDAAAALIALLTGDSERPLRGRLGFV